MPEQTREYNQNFKSRVITEEEAKRISGSQIRFNGDDQRLSNSFYQSKVEEYRVSESSSRIYENSNNDQFRGMTANSSIYMQRNSNLGQSSVYESRNGAGVLKGEMYQIGEYVGDKMKKETRQGEGVLVEIREGESRIKSQTTLPGETKIISEVEMEHNIQVSEKSNFVQERTDIEIIKREKIINVTKEVPVKRIVYVDKEVEVIVNIPIKRTIEVEEIEEVIIEREVEKIIEIPVEEDYDQIVDKVYEQEVEYEKIVEVPVERLVQKEYEVIREEVVWIDRLIEIDEKDISKYPGARILDTQVDLIEKERIVERPYYVDNVIEREIRVPYNRIIEVPKERIVEKVIRQVVDRPVAVERIVEKVIEEPIDNLIYKDVNVYVERPVYIENIIEKPVPVDVIIEKEILVPVEHIIERPVYIDNVIEKIVEHIVQVPVAVEETIEVPVEIVTEVAMEVEQIIETTVEKIIRKSVPKISIVRKPVDYFVERLVEKKVVKEIEVVVNRYVEISVEKIIEKPIHINRVVEIPREIEKIIEVPVEHIREVIKTVEKIIEKPVFIDIIIEKEVEVIVEQIVEVMVEKIIEVEVETLVEKPVYVEKNTENQIFIETEVEELYQETETEKNEDYEDPELENDINFRKNELELLKKRNTELRENYDRLKGELIGVKSKISYADQQENVRLSSRCQELSSRINLYNDRKTKLIKKSVSRSTIQESNFQMDPRVDILKSKLRNLINQNQALVSQISSKGEFIRKSVRNNSNRGN